ncbi:MAG TPA: PQQ-binding-like beta-propeller repeat protein, partial [Planctomycetota bacterium]|nr:PQQ-binding-like beta-propeller repeat protein [Planctomycetota bacterium]
TAMSAMMQLSLLGYSYDVLTDEMIDAGELSRFKVVVAPLMYYLLPKQVQALEAFTANGGTLITGTRSTLIPKGTRKIDDDFQELPYAAGFWDFNVIADVGHAWVGAQLRQKAPILRKAIEPVLEPYARPQGDSVVLQTGSAGSIRYTYVVNFLYPSWLGTGRITGRPEHSAGSGEGNESTIMPQQPLIDFPAGAIVYDLFSHEKLSGADGIRPAVDGGAPEAAARTAVRCDMSFSPFRILVSLPAEIAKLQVDLPEAATLGTTFPVSVVPLDAAGKPIDGTIPVEVTAIDAAGQVVAAIPGISGSGGVRVPASIGFKPGTWKLRIAELVGGRIAETDIRAEAPQKLPFGDAVREVPRVDVQRPDQLRSFIQDRAKDKAPVLILLDDEQYDARLPVAQALGASLKALGIAAEISRTNAPGVFAAGERMNTFGGRFVEMNPMQYIDHHVALIGGEGESVLVEELQNSQLFEREMTQDYPGPGRAILSIVRSPFAYQRDALCLLGSDNDGLLAAAAAVKSLPNPPAANAEPAPAAKLASRTLPIALPADAIQPEPSGDPVQVITSSDGTGRFRDQAASFADAAERVLQAANRKNWPTEGKYPSRTGFVPDARFGPPFRMAFANPSTSFHDRVGVGSLVWSESGLICGLPFQMFPAAWGLTSGTCVQDGILYAGLKTGQMLAVDAVKGSLVWSFPGEGPCYGTPLLYRDVLYYGSLDRRLYAIDVHRGRMLWNFPAHGWIEGSPAAEGGTVFVGARSGDFYAVDARLGVQRWQAKLDGRIIGTPACSGGRVFIGTQAGMFYALDAASGKTAWSFKAAGSIDGGSCVGYDRVFFGDRSGQVYALNVGDGKLAWPQPVGVSGPVVASPIIVDRVIYGGTADGSTFWGIDIDDAVVGWSEPVANEGAVCRPPLFAGDQLVFVSRDWQRGLVGFVMAAPQQHACYTAKGAIEIDGDLSEPEWKQAPRLPVFLKHNGMQVGDPVDARLMWDGARLLFGITVTDANLQAAAANRDDDMARDDSITIAIDPNRGGLAVPVLRVSARGVQADSIVTGLGRAAADPKFQEDLANLKLEQTGPAWNPEWQAAVRLQGSLNNPGDQDTAWTAEIAIPFESLPPGLFNQKPGPNTTWQANVIVHSIGNGPAPAPEHRTWCVCTVLDPGSLGVPSRWMPFRLDAKTVDEFAKQPQKR